jgi:hypothetical protein
MSSRRWTPKLADALMVILLLGTGFVAGAYTTGSLDEPVNQSSEMQEYPQGELKQESAASGSGFIQALMPR